MEILLFFVLLFIMNVKMSDTSKMQMFFLSQFKKQD